MGVKVREKKQGSGEWWVFINHNGIRKSKKVGDLDTANEVAEKLRAKLVLGDMTALEEKANNSVPTLRDYAAKWLIMPNSAWTESTRQVYTDNFNKHVFPKLGKFPLNRITRKDLKGFFDDLLVKGLAPKTVDVIRAALSGLLNHALDSEWIESNPLQGLRINGGKKTNTDDIDPLTDEEAETLLNQAKDYQGGIWHAPVLCLLRTGMRIGEVQGLQWGDIDFNGRFIEVKRSWRKHKLTPTKNRKRRRVDMSPHLADTLEILRVLQKKKALEQGRPLSVYVFANQDGENMCREKLRRALNKCLEKAKLRRVTIHDLRHSYATIRLMRGHNLLDVSHQLGHSSTNITETIYCHWIPGKFKNEVDELDEAHPPAPYPHPTRHSL